MVATMRPEVLLIVHDPSVRELDAMILEDAGYQVEEVPDDADPVTVAEQTRPQVIVVGMRYNVQEDWQILDRLQGNAQTKAIPVVVVSTEERIAAVAAAGPNVSETVVAPYDITALEDAVAAAIGKPPAAAVLPNPQHPVPPDQVVAADALQQQSRTLILRSIENLLRSGAYRQHFAGLSTELIDNLGLLLGAIIAGLQKDVPPDRVFATPVIQKTLRDHLLLRRHQGLGLAQVIRETHALEAQIDRALQGLIGPSFSTGDALAVTRKVRAYFNAMQLQEIGEDERLASHPEPPAAH
jgi:CheY-like chemotaxis protein